MVARWPKEAPVFEVAHDIAELRAGTIMEAVEPNYREWSSFMVARKAEDGSAYYLYPSELVPLTATARAMIAIARGTRRAR